MSCCAPSSTPSDTPTPYENENPSPLHESTATISSGPSSKSAPHGLFAKLKEKKDALEKNFNEGIARSQSDEGVRLVNNWNSQHESICFGLSIASTEKWQEHEDKKQAK